jgi:hypothetical protein
VRVAPSRCFIMAVPPRPPAFSEAVDRTTIRWPPPAV